MDNLNRKLRTRKALMNGALELVAEGQHFSSLSLREVAKRAGVVPNAFYRHFKSLDELGLALADEVGLLLRQLMRQARLQGLAADRMISDSVDFFIDNVMANPALFRFMSQSRTGGSENLRFAIRNELSFFATEMVMDLNRLRILSHIDAADLDMIGHLVVQTVSGIAGEILDLPPQSKNLVNGIRQRTIKQLRLIFLGAGSWHSSEEQEKKRKKKPKPSDSLALPPASDLPQAQVLEEAPEPPLDRKAAAKEKQRAKKEAAAKKREELKAAKAAAAKQKAKERGKAKARAAQVRAEKKTAKAKS
jgi:AcrR family transcriptional regulator